MAAMSTTTTFPFVQFALCEEQDWFATLSDGIHWENVAKGRQGAVLMDCTADGSVPMVRSTTKYKRPHQLFRPAHIDLIMAILAHTPGLRFNNALIERYSSDYRTMGAHSDQAMDLDNDSYICLFTCYNKPGMDTRQLIVTDKVSGEEQVFVLEHCTAIMFSVEDNARYRHRIVAGGSTAPNDCIWLGITLRYSIRAVHYVDGKAYIEDKELKLLRSKDDAHEFYKERGLENRYVGKFLYSPAVVCSTISPSDIMMPLKD
jgi:hypothetical protein